MNAVGRTTNAAFCPSTTPLRRSVESPKMAPTARGSWPKPWSAGLFIVTPSTVWSDTPAWAAMACIEFAPASASRSRSAWTAFFFSVSTIASTWSRTSSNGRGPASCTSSSLTTTNWSSASNGSERSPSDAVRSQRTSGRPTCKPGTTGFASVTLTCVLSRPSSAAASLKLRFSSSVNTWKSSARSRMRSKSPRTGREIRTISASCVARPSTRMR